MVQVRSLAELLPNLDVVADDPFNSSPTDASLMGQDVLARGRAGEELPVVQAPTPLVGCPSHLPCWLCFSKRDWLRLCSHAEDARAVCHAVMWSLLQVLARGGCLDIEQLETPPFPPPSQVATTQLS